MKFGKTTYIPVVVPHTVIDIWTVVVKHLNTSVTHFAMFGPCWFDCPTCMAESTEEIFSIVPFTELGNLQCIGKIKLFQYNQIYM